jgi:hypothetical protein
VYEFLKLGTRTAEHHRKTNETDIFIQLNLDGSGKSDIETGLPFFDHMLDQLARHGALDLTIKAKGDLHIDEHHTIEDTGIALGEVFLKALGTNVELSAIPIRCQWMIVWLRLHWILVVATGLCGMRNLNGRRSAICLRKCFSTSLSRFQMLHDRI